MVFAILLQNYHFPRIFAKPKFRFAKLKLLHFRKNARTNMCCDNPSCSKPNLLLGLPITQSQTVWRFYSIIIVIFYNQNGDVKNMNLKKRQLLFFIPILGVFVHKYENSSFISQIKIVLST